MDRIDSMRLFTRIVDLGSFTLAADDLQLPRASVTLAIQQLERRLGTRLLQRTTRHVSTTPDGAAYFERCQRLLADFEETESVFAGARPRGKLRVSLQGTVARTYVVPRLTEFFERYPDVELELSLTDRFVDLVREGIDCALRGGELRDSSLVARRIALLPEATLASRDYFKRFGIPKTLEDLKEHRAVNFISSATGRAMPFEFNINGALRRVPMKGIVAVNDVDAFHACCRAGLGLIQAPFHHLGPQLASGELREVLSEFRPDPTPLSVLYPQQRQLSARVRAFVDWLAEVLEDLPHSAAKTAVNRIKAPAARPRR